MYKNVYYSDRSNKISLWEVSDSDHNKTSFNKLDYDCEYYVACPANQEPDTKDIYGRPLKKRSAKHYEAIKKVKDIHKLVGDFYSAETDIEPEVKFLQQKYAGLELKNNMANWNICFIDIEIAAESEFPKPEEAKYPINLITVKSSRTQQITTFGLDPYTGGSNKINEYHYVPDEKDLLLKFVKWFRKQKFDVITGWNVRSFDIHYIVNRIKNIHPNTELENGLSPLNKIIDRKEYYDIAGLAILDYLELYKNFTFKTEPSYTLQHIGNKITGRGKLDLDGSVNTIYKTNWNQFVEYNVQDVILVEDIDKELQFLDLAITFAYNALIPINRVFSSIATIEGYMLKYMHAKGMCMPDRQHNVKDWWYDQKKYLKTLPGGSIEKQNWKEDATPFISPFYCKGGHVEAKPGLYKNVLSFDVESLYPHMIIQYNISPETKIINPSQFQIETENLIESEVNGVYYRRAKGILPEIVSVIFDERKYYKNLMFTFKEGSQEYRYNDRQQHVRKILINSMYGVMINKHFHFYDVDNARAVTRGGRVLIRYLSKQTNEYFHNYFHKTSKNLFPDAEPKKLIEDVVSVIDTDSCYVKLDEIKRHYAPNMTTMEFAKIIEPFMTNFYQQILKIKADAKGLEQCIRFKREGIITKQFVQAKKKYIVELLQKEKDVYDPPKISYTGIEVKRSSTPAFVKENIEDAVKNIFDNLDKDENLKLIKNVWKEFRKQPIDRIASVGSVKEYTKYASPVQKYIDQGGVSFVSGAPMRNKAAICYNYMITKYKYPMMPIADGSKIKYIRVDTNNPTGNDAIAWVGNFPSEFGNHFKVDYDAHFEKEFLGVLNRIWCVLGWTDEKIGIQIKQSKLGGFLS